MRLKFLALLILAWELSASQVGPGTWKDHLSLNACFSVAKVGTKIYGANYTGLYYME